MLQRNILIVADSFITKKANKNPNDTLPTSPINTLAFGKLKGKKPRQADTKEILINAMSGSLVIKYEKKVISPNPTMPVNPAIPFIPSIKL